MRILVIDNYDSFVYNLVQYLGELGEECTVWRNDAPELGTASGPEGLDAVQEGLDAALGGFDAILLSPGPGEPTEAGRMPEVITWAVAHRVPLFGVCLGHQAIALHFGGRVVRAGELFHGKTSPVVHDGTGVLAGIPSPFTVARYHSLTVARDSVPAELVVTGEAPSGMIMSIRHRELPVHSVQFHPESVMTEHGHRILANWLADAGRPVDDAQIAALEARHAAAQQASAAVIG
jgi:para-aminobenzoate synthetase component 2